MKNFRYLLESIRNFKIKFIFILIALGGVLSFNHSFLGNSIQPSEAQSNQSQLINWLNNQQDPSTGLISSVLVNSEDPDYKKSWVYDNALAITVWSLSGECVRAKQGVSTLASLVDSDGKISFSYFSDNLAVVDARYRTGTIAWLGYAFVLYENHCQDSAFQSTALNIGNWILSMQIQTNGTVLGGPDVDWQSTEHALDSFHFLYLLGQQTNNITYLNAAEDIKNGLLNYHWNDKFGCFNRGMWDDVQAVDAFVWGALFLISIGQIEKAKKCLEVVEATFASSVQCNIDGVVKWIDGYKPYSGIVDNVNWDDTELAYSELMASTALAYRRIGNNEKYQEILNELDKLQGANNGILYACPERQDFRMVESLAGSAWVILATLEDESQFWGQVANVHQPKSSRHTQVVIPGPLNSRINTWNGNFHYSELLFSIPSQNTTLELAINFNSNHQHSDVYSSGWQIGHEIYYKSHKDNAIQLIWSDGSEDLFTYLDGKYFSPVGNYDHLEEYSPGKYSLTKKDGTIYYFENPVHKHLTRVVDTNQNNLYFTYNDDLLLDTISDDAGKSLRLAYVEDLVVKVFESNDINERAYLLSYDEQGNLQTISNPAGYQTAFEYDQNNQLVTISPPRGESLRLEYSFGLISQLTYGTEKKALIFNTLEQKTSVTDINGSEQIITTYHYDNDGRISSIMDSLGRQISTEWDENNNLVRQIDANGAETHFSFDDRGNILSIKDDLGIMTYIEYESTFNKITKITNGRGYGYQFLYDIQGNVIEEINPIKQSTKYSYNNFGMPVSRLDPSGSMTFYEYNDMGLLTKEIAPSGVETKFEYDEVGRLTNEENPDIEVHYKYDDLNRVTGVSLPTLGKTISYFYDPFGNRTKMVDSEGGNTEYVYDNLNRLTSLTNPQGQTTSFSYDQLNRLISKTLANGTVSTNQYDSIGQLISIQNKHSNGSLISSYSYTYDKMGNRLSVTTLNGETTKYAYDALNRLQLVVFPNGLTESYTYDSNGNRILFTSTGHSTESIFNKADQILEQGEATFTWDVNGNMLSRKDSTGITTYEYDHNNWLISVRTPNSTQVEYTYYPDGRKLSRQLSQNEKTTYIYDGLNVLLELDGTNDSTVRYTSAGIDHWLSLEQGENDYYYLQDGLGSTVQLINASEQTVASYKYSPFGEVLQISGNVDNPYLFTGRRYESDINIYDYRARVYDPELGRFLQQDPLGFIDGPNLYSYVNNNPINYIDPFGTEGSSKSSSESNSSPSIGKNGEIMYSVKELDSKNDFPDPTAVTRKNPSKHAPLIARKNGEPTTITGKKPEGSGSNSSSGNSSNQGGDGGDDSPVGPGSQGGGDSAPPQMQSFKTEWARLLPQPQVAFQLDDLLPENGPDGTSRVLTDPAAPLLTNFSNAVDVQGVDFRKEAEYQFTTTAAALVTKSIDEPYTHDLGTCNRFRGYSLDQLTSVHLPGIGLDSNGQSPPEFWYLKNHFGGFVEEGFVFSVFVDESSNSFTVDSRWLRTEYSCYWLEQLDSYDYVLSFQIWASSSMESYALLAQTIDNLRTVSPGWTLHFAQNSSVPNPSVNFSAGWMNSTTIRLRVHSHLNEDRLVRFFGTFERCEGCGPLTYAEQWRLIKPGVNFIELPSNGAQNAIILSEADNFIDKIYIVAEDSPFPSTSEPTIISIFLPLLGNNFSTDLPEPPNNIQPSITFTWPFTKDSVLVGRHLLGDVTDETVTVHGMAEGLKSGWTISLYVETDILYYQGEATIQDGVWSSRIKLTSDDPNQFYKIHAILEDEHGEPVKSISIDEITKIATCIEP